MGKGKTKNGIFSQTTRVCIEQQCFCATIGKLLVSKETFSKSACNDRKKTCKSHKHPLQDIVRWDKVIIYDFQKIYSTIIWDFKALQCLHLTGICGAEMLPPKIAHGDKDNWKNRLFGLGEEGLMQWKRQGVSPLAAVARGRSVALLFKVLWIRRGGLAPDRAICQRASQ